MKTSNVVMAALLLPGWLWAGAVPPQIAYQGTIKQQNVPVNGTLTMSFRLTNSDGTAVYWSSGNQSVAVNQGLFSSVLSPAGVDWQNVNPYVEVSVGGQTLLPREPLGTSAYAFMSAGVIDAAITTASLADASITASKLASQSVTTNTIAPGAVTSAAIANGAVVTAGIAPQAVTSANLAGNAVTTAAIADGSVTASKLAPDAQGITVPAGMVALFTTACPSGWTRFTALDGLFPMGGPNYGVTGGAATHVHSISMDGAHNHGGSTGGSSVNDNNQWLFGDPQGSGSHWNNFADAAHTHGIAMDGNHNHGGQTGAASSLPPFVTMVYCSRNP